MRRAAMALVGVLVLALTGCSWSQASVAAQVGDTTITVAAVNQLAKDIVTTYTQNGRTVDAKAAPQAAFGSLVIGALLNQAPDKGESLVPPSAITDLTQPDPSITDPAQKAQAEQTAALVNALLALPNGKDYLRGQLVLGQLQTSADFGAAFAQITSPVPVTLNPRFGTWDPATGWFSGETGSLSVDRSAQPAS